MRTRIYILKHSLFRNRYRIAKIVFTDDGLVDCKFALSSESGEWIPVAEGEDWPDECEFKQQNVLAVAHGRFDQVEEL